MGVCMTRWACVVSGGSVCLASGECGYVLGM